MAKYGYWTDYSGATRRVQIIAEAKDGRLLIAHPSFRSYAGAYILAQPEKVKDIQEELQAETGIGVEHLKNREVKLTMEETNLLMLCLHEYIKLVKQDFTSWEPKETALSYYIKPLAEKLECQREEVKGGG